MSARTESEIQNAILEQQGRAPDLTIWRNNTGVSRSEVVTRAHLERLLAFLSAPSSTGVRGNTKHSFHEGLAKGRALVMALLEERPRFTPFGLCKGSSDLIAIVSVELAGIVGMPRIGVFVALEVKIPGKNPDRDQQLFLDLVNRRGGIGRCVHSEEEAEDAINEARAL